MKIARWIGNSLGITVLSVCLVMAPVALVGCISVDATVTLISQLAVNFLNSCASFVPGYGAACAAASAGVQAVANEIIATHDAYVASPKDQGKLAAFKAAIAAGIAKFPDILKAINIPGAGLITLALNLILSTITILAGTLHVPTPVLVTARLRAATLGFNPKSINDVKRYWNAHVCGNLTGNALTACVVK